MCGINGIYGNVSGVKSRIQAMNEALAHRGPDAEGIYAHNHICLGHRRLAIIDLNTAANQPMSDPSERYTLIFNGEIYNYRELRRQLTGFQFSTESDTEVLLAGLIKWGSDFLKMCNGMFSLGFWDAETETLLLARDRMGIKPLYYARKDDVLVFSSEIRALLKSGLVPAKLNRNVLGEYLRYQTVHGENTMVDGVFTLPPGACMQVNDEGAEIKTYWHLVKDAERSLAGLSYEDTTRLVRTRFEKAVERRLVADVPFGAFLSGGIDSSAIVGVASQMVSEPLRTFTVTFDDEGYSEAAYANIVAKKFNTDHQEVKLSPKTLIDSLPDALSAMDHPSGDGINTYVVSKAAKDAGITMVLSGLGGDELFAGYPVFHQISMLQEKKWLLSFPKFARRIMGNVQLFARPGVASQKISQLICEDYFDTEYAYQYSREVASAKVNEQFLKDRPKGGSAVFDLVHAGVGYGSEGFRLPLLSRVSFAELSTYLQAVLLRDTDQMSMAHALEVRVPFLDHELVQTVLAIPDKYKYPFTPKKLFVDAMEGILPSEIVNRPKMGFTFPWDAWMRNELRPFCEAQIKGLGSRDAFNSHAIERRWQAFLKGDLQVGWSRIWHLCILEAWLKQNGID